LLLLTKFKPGLSLQRQPYYHETIATFITDAN